MDPLVGAALISTGSAAIGGYLSSRDNKKAAAMNAKQQERFAKKGIQWRVADAKKAGVLPEYALGAPGASFSPTYTGSERGSMIADAGQNIARSVLAAGTKADREMDTKMKAETLRGMQLENEIRATQLTGINNPGNPAFPHMKGNVIEGQGDTPVRDVPLERTGQHRSSRYSEGASIPSVGWTETPDGGLRPVPSSDVKNRIEDQMIPEAVWATQNLVAPNFGSGPKPPREALPSKNHYWRWSRSRQAWYPKRRNPQTGAEPNPDKYIRRYKWLGR